MTPDETPEPPYHLILNAAEVSATASSLRLLIGDEAHEPDIRALARDVLGELDGEPDDSGRLTIELTPPQMKITHSAVRLLVNDLGRAEADERDVLRGVLEKLPDEHVMRAIQLD
ncbi:MAG TPA: hypothetical protein VMA83_01585 [Solirubrobacteraceae bacterium]|nr:hypothetical protein [Solirubrobacteraceae bacterium]